jgi:polysaccharide biosynthesis/export protein
MLARTLLIVGCALALAPLHSVTAQQSDYVIAPRDVLSVTVWNQADLSGKFKIDADGTFMFPLVGRVQAASRSPRDVADKLKKLLADGYIKDPQLSVVVEPYRTQTVYVMGEVRQAGSYPLTREMTLIEILARAGSTTERAGAVVVITRPRTGGEAVTSSGEEAGPPELIRVNLNSLQSGAASENILLRDGDTIFVPRAESFYVLGAVKNPGSYTAQDPTTVLKALALAGGLTERGSSGRIRIIREVAGSKKQIKVKLDELVQPGDTIIVGERLF